MKICLTGQLKDRLLLLFDRQGELALRNRPEGGVVNLLKSFVLAGPATLAVTETSPLLGVLKSLNVLYKFE